MGLGDAKCLQFEILTALTAYFSTASIVRNHPTFMFKEALIIVWSKTECFDRRSSTLKEWQERRVGVPLEVQTDRGKYRCPMHLPTLALVQIDAPRQSMIAWIAPSICMRWRKRSRTGRVNARRSPAPAWRAAPCVTGTRPRRSGHRRRCRPSSRRPRGVRPRHDVPLRSIL